MKKSRGFSMERFFLALGDRTRLRLLNLMSDREICVCYFVEVLGQSQPKISRHLAYLRKAGIVSARREGRWIHYRIAQPPSPAAALVLRETLVWLRDQRQMQSDMTLLMKICRDPEKLIAIGNAPVPWRQRFFNSLGVR